MKLRTTVGRFFFCFFIARMVWMGSSLGAGPSATTELVAGARSQLGVTTSYDPAYVAIKYPGGDVPPETGVCADVIIRAYRAEGCDLQKLVHQDMSAHFEAYPRRWNLNRPDANIDHRRVANLMTFFRRQHASLNLSKSPGDYVPGDVVSWDLGGGVLHIGLVSDRSTAAGVPLMIHNIGQGAQEEDILFRFQIVGHYRFPITATSGSSA